MDQLRWRYQYTILALCTGAFFATMVARLGISPLVPAITANFSISNTAIGLALSGMWLAYALAQFPSGILGNRFGERIVILIAIGGTTVMTILLAVSPVFPVFVVFVILLGGVAGLHYSVATTFLTRVYKDSIGTAIGIHTAGGPAAGLIAPPAAAWVGTQFGWRAGVAIGAVVAAPVFVLFAWRIRPTDAKEPDKPMTEKLELGPLVLLLSRPSIAFTVGIAASFAFIWQAIASFLPAFLIDYHGHSATLSGLVFAGYFVVQAVTKPFVGSLSDKYNRDSVIIGCMLITSVGFGVFLVYSYLVAIGVAVLLVSIGLGVESAIEPRFMDNLSAEERNTGFGLVRTVYLILGSLGSVVVGFLSDIFGWLVAFGALTVLSLAVLVAIVITSILE
ncbi:MULTISPECIES: MFS transporter [Natrialbaceae]|uniref:MFS transporter n=1 Tax=Natrialbaceae TaxID=1644061 RepID=UPI00207D4826|nr:MFS transporter [Natronococcus sp. CG52]